MAREQAQGRKQDSGRRRVEAGREHFDPVPVALRSLGECVDVLLPHVDVEELETSNSCEDKPERHVRVEEVMAEKCRASGLSGKTAK